MSVCFCVFQSSRVHFNDPQLANNPTHAAHQKYCGGKTGDGGMRKGDWMAPLPLCFPLVPSAAPATLILFISSLPTLCLSSASLPPAFHEVHRNTHTPTHTIKSYRQAKFRLISGPLK